MRGKTAIEVAGLVLAVALSSCATGGVGADGAPPDGMNDAAGEGDSGVTDGEADRGAPDAAIDGETGAVDADDAGPETRTCDGPCDSPPAPSCGPSAQADGGDAGDAVCRRNSHLPGGRCESASCVYPPIEEECPFGCDPDAGDCRLPPGFCSDVPCGTVHECGGACEHDAGCCTPTSYTRSSGFTYSGFVLCCDEGDRATSVVDCGDGDNHWVTPSGESCGVAYEGPDNRGGPCVSLTCEGEECW